MFLSTKGGFVHEDADFGITADVVLDKLVNSGQIEASDIYDSNCIHPKFLELQLSASLSNLGVESIDCYSLNLPEIHLYRQDVAAFHKSLLVS
jgi:aryl-alcohol dehydrogenase-like predicted oxidoreductase